MIDALLFLRHDEMSTFPSLTDDQIQKYLDRIDLKVLDRNPSLALLDQLILHHISHIPFENGRLLLLKTPVSLAFDDIFNTLVTDRRGSYCFAQNSLFASVLLFFGFIVTPGFARVCVWNESLELHETRGITHMILFVEIPGEASPLRLVDVGFGGNGLDRSIVIQKGARVACSRVESHCIREASLIHGSKIVTGIPDQGFYLMHQRASGVTPPLGSDTDGWSPQFYFTLTPGIPNDYVIPNFYASHDPTFKFNLHLAVVIIKPNGRSTLSNRVFCKRSTEGEERVDIESLSQMTTILEQEFGIFLSLEEIARLKVHLDLKA